LSVYKTETEQVDDLKRWIKSYGPSILIGIVLALSINYGWKFWQSYKAKQANLAGQYYTAMLGAYQQENHDTLLENANALRAQFSHSPYTQFAHMLLAKQAILANDYPSALSHLSAITHNTKDTTLNSMAQIRIARIQIQQQNPAAALKTLALVNNTYFQGLVASIKGDAYAQLGQYEQAKIMYQTALTQIAQADEIIPILRLKLNNLAIPAENTQ
jgi:predicted negative regulator of RcsB-dependent stress response